MDFQGRTALVTGAARGIGRTIAEKLASGGANIIIVDVASPESAQTALDAVRAYGVKASYCCLDITNGEKVTEAVNGFIKEYGKIDILVNNAGITKDKLLMMMSESEFDAVINVNLKGTFIMTKALVRHMMKNRYGRIINMASVVGLMGNVGQANYSASKAGVIALTKTTAKEFAARGITCNAVAPGFIDTSMTAVLSEEAKKAMFDMIPMGRTGKPEDVANAVEFLASESSAYITGEVIKVDGGLYI